MQLLAVPQVIIRKNGTQTFCMLICSTFCPGPHRLEGWLRHQGTNVLLLTHHPYCGGGHDYSVMGVAAVTLDTREF